MKKVLVVGPSGAGKSEFSKILSKKLNLPLYHLDNIYWKENKTHISRSEFDDKIEKLLLLDEWIIDGDYSRTYEVRFKNADAIIFLDYPLGIALSGAKTRVGKKRTDIPWVEKSFDPEFGQWIENWFIETRPLLINLLTKYKDKEIIVFKNRDEANHFLETLKD